MYLVITLQEKLKMVLFVVDLDNQCTERRKLKSLRTSEIPELHNNYYDSPDFRQANVVLL